jgi:hypothetical protein
MLGNEKFDRDEIINNPALKLPREPVSGLLGLLFW